MKNLLIQIEADMRELAKKCEAEADILETLVKKPEFSSVKRSIAEARCLARVYTAISENPMLLSGIVEEIINEE
jgi:hypothetical protein